MLLCLDIGNSHICGGIFVGKELLLQFRYDSKQVGTSDELGVFIRSVLRENDIDYRKIEKVGIASVVPAIDYTVRATCIKYLNNESPLFLVPGLKTGIQIKTHNPNEVGADLIAGAIAAKNLYPYNNILIFDLGTATTACYITRDGEFMGGAIAPGIRLMMDSLQSNTAKLFEVSIVNPKSVIGKQTKASIQSGIYYSQLGLIKEVIQHTIDEYNLTEKLTVIATGGFSHLFAQSQVFDHHIPELVLLGVKKMLELN
ncbi:MAG: type III pantothenate kinase [Burkholderiales bacterium]|nr:type III pantothenate kinase [Burkholderiales bacterium]